MPTKKNYHKPPEDPIGGGLKEKGRECPPSTPLRQWAVFA